MSYSGKAFWLIVLTLFSASVCAREILIVTPGNSSPLINEFSLALRAQLPQDNIRLIGTAEPDASSADIVVTLGSNMLDWRLNSPLQTPTIAVYVNSHTLPAQLPAYLQVLLANPKPLRQLQLAKRLIPRMRTAGLLYAEHEDTLKSEWNQALSASGLQQQSATLEQPENLTRDVLRVLDRSDVLMGVDEPAIYNADNLKTILLTSYSRNKVLIGPSAPFIEAGSLSTTYSSAQDMARSVALLLEQDELSSGASYPAFFSVLSNAQVARSLGLPIPDDAKLGRELSGLEQSP